MSTLSYEPLSCLSCTPSETRSSSFTDNHNHHKQQQGGEKSEVKCGGAEATEAEAAAGLTCLAKSKRSMDSACNDSLRNKGIAVSECSPTKKKRKIELWNKLLDERPMGHDDDGESLRLWLIRALEISGIE